MQRQAATEQDYALPDQVGAYGTRADFERSRKESGQWVFWRDRVDLVLAGRYDEVMPLHVELSPTYLCNFSCPWCSCRSAREVWSDENVFAHPQATDRTVMNPDRLTEVVEHLGEHRIGIQWVGGEPTMHPGLLPAARRANELGIKQCLFTNGSVLGERRIQSLFESELVFIRVSLDAVSKDIHQRHHGYSDRRPYAEIVLRNLDALVRQRQQSAAATMIGVSIVVDECNLQDVVPTLRHLASLCDAYGNGAVDFVIIRPTYQFYNSPSRLQGSTASDLRRLVAAGSEVVDLLEDRGVSIVTPAASFEIQTSDEPLDQLGDACLSCGWFGEVTPTGEMVVCSDRYGNPEYVIGSVENEQLDSLWAGEQRAAVLAYVHRVQCFKTRCPRNGRGFQLNRVFHQIERFRDAGQLDDVRAWIDDLRTLLPEPTHSFFL